MMGIQTITTVGDKGTTSLRCSTRTNDAKDYATLKKVILLHYMISMERTANSNLELLLERRVKLIEISLLGYRIWQISGHRGVTQKRS